jgi:hypothetical protein
VQRCGWNERVLLYYCMSRCDNTIFPCFIFHDQHPMISENTELNIWIKFCEMIGETAADDTMQIAFGVAAMSWATGFKWFNLVSVKWQETNNLKRYIFFITHIRQFLSKGMGTRPSLFHDCWCRNREELVIFDFWLALLCRNWWQVVKSYHNRW